MALPRGCFRAFEFVCALAHSAMGQALETRHIPILDVPAELFVVMCQWFYTDEVALPPNLNPERELQAILTPF
jgi:hypothetical protein